MRSTFFQIFKTTGFLSLVLCVSFASASYIPKRPVPIPKEAYISQSEKFDIALFAPMLMSSEIKVPQYEKLEIGVDLPNGINQSIKRFIHHVHQGIKINPFDSAQIDVYAIFTHPETGTSHRVNGFYYEEFRRVTNHPKKEKWSWQDDTTSYIFRVRFAEGKLGKWQVQTYIKMGEEEAMKGSSFGFTMVASDNKGFVVKGNRGDESDKFLRFTTGETYIPIGETVAYDDWAELKPSSYDYFEKTIDELADNGANMARLWMNVGAFLIERERLGVYGREYSPYHKKEINRQHYAWEFDRVMEHCRKRNVYVMMAWIGAESDKEEDWGIPPHGWEYNPYRKELNLDTHYDFFKSDSARFYVKRRYRYIMARWGYDCYLPFYELIGEPSKIGEDYKGGVAVIEDWLSEMSDYVHEQDYHYHLTITDFANSSASSNWRKNYWMNTSLDIAGVNDYGTLSNTNFENRWKKANSWRSGKIQHMPYINVEFGAGINTGIDDATDIELHNALWSSLFSGAAGPAVPYWWEPIHEAGFQTAYKPVGKYCENLNLHHSRFKQQKWGDGLNYEGVVSYSLTSVSNDTIYGWTHNTDYYWANMKFNNEGIAKKMKNCEEGFKNGNDGHFEYPYCDQSKFPTADEKLTQQKKLKVKILNLDAFSKYKVEWYDTQGDGGHLKEFDTVAKTGFGIFGSADLKLRMPVYPDPNKYQDFAYKIYKIK